MNAKLEDNFKRSSKNPLLIFEAISRKYQVSITDLKTWNKLSSNALAMGQTLKINLKKEAKAEATNPLKDNKIAGSPPTEPAEVPPTTEQQGETDTTAKEKSSEPMAYQGAPFKSYEIDGLAEVIQEEDPSDKFLALHRTAKTGTVIKVKNLMNNLTVYVKVVGIIADTSANDNVIIKLNKKAYEHLKAVDKRFQVQLSYFQ